MFKLSMCRICLVENVNFHSIVGTNLHEVYEKLTEIPFETKDCRPLQVCYICRERLRHCYKLHARCHQSEEVLTHILNNGPKPPSLQDTHMFKISQPIIHVDIAPSPNSLCDDGHIDDNQAKTKPLKMLDYVQVKEEHYEDADNQNIEINDTEENNTEEIDHFGMEIKQEFLPELEQISGNPIENESDITEVIFSETRKIEEIQTELKHKTKKRKVYNKKPYVDNQNIEVNDAEEINTEEIDHFGMEIKQEFSLDVEQISGNPIESESDITEVILSETRKKEEIQSEMKHKIIEVDNIKPLVTVSEKPIQSALNENLTTISSNLGTILIQQNETTNDQTQSIGQFMKEQTFFKCDICSKCFYHRNNYNDHVRTHTGEKPYQCLVCDKCFRQKQHLVVHIRTHTGVKPYKCDVCEKAFTRNSYLKAHKPTHRVNNPPNDKIQTVKFHANKTIALKTQSGIIGNSSKLENHTLTKIYKCNICHKDFTTKSSLNIHIRIHTGEQPYQCSYCDKAFRRKQNLVVHTRTHTGEKPYKCDVCEKSFARKSGLKVHQGIHADVKLHLCEIYGKGFVEKINLVNHVRAHNIEKPFQCDKCGKSFSYRKLLIDHIRSKGI